MAGTERARVLNIATLHCYQQKILTLISITKSNNIRCDGQAQTAVHHQQRALTLNRYVGHGGLRAFNPFTASNLLKNEPETTSHGGLQGVALEALEEAVEVAAGRQSGA
jgi:hypothetical protein